MDAWAGVSKAPAAPAVNIEAHATDARKKARGVQPGSFLSLMISSKHQDGRGVSDDEATSQAFTFLLAGYETTVTPLDVSLALTKHNIYTGLSFSQALATLVAVCTRALAKFG